MENITFSQIERKDLPLYEEVKAKGKDYVSYGKDNLFLNTFGIYICVQCIAVYHQWHRRLCYR